MFYLVLLLAALEHIVWTVRGTNKLMLMLMFVPGTVDLWSYIMPIDRYSHISLAAHPEKVYYFRIFLSPVSTKLRKGDIALGSVRPSVRTA